MATGALLTPSTNRERGWSRFAAPNTTLLLLRRRSSTQAFRSCWPCAWALDSEETPTKDRVLYGLLAAVFVVSRLAYYLAGVRFDARPVLHYFQFVDPELLKHRLIESMYYFHVQPPGWNLYAGIVLKLFPQ